MSPSVSFKCNRQPFFRRYWFIDGTFEITPHRLFQCVLVKTYDCGTDLYVPCAFALDSGKKKYM
ncbi:hypothetical protein HZS_5249 [Henneguya salminicola]|nr:hypothetical protein HZS_5249 [Henneguya salminicola]